MVRFNVTKTKSEAFWLLAAGAAVYVGFRLLTLFTAIENVSWTEELGIGTIAREIILGLKKPFFAYQIDCYAGESLISALLTAPFFKLFGMNLFVLKAVTLFCSALTVLAAAFFLNRHFGIKAALWAIFFFTFSPPAFTGHSLIPMNGHSESLLWSVLMLAAFYEFIFSKNKSILFLCLFGALGGFSFWFYYACGIAFAVCLIAWLWIDSSSLFSRKGGFTALFFLIGFSPWLILGQAHSYDGGRYLFSIFRNPDLWSIPRFCSRLFAQTVFSFPRSFSFLPPDHPWRDIGAYSYFLFFIAAFLPFWSGKLFAASSAKAYDKKCLFFLVYPLIFLFVYAVTDFVIPQGYPQGTVEFRYYTPLYFFCVMLLALSANSIKTWKWILLPLIAFSLLAQRNVLFKEPFGRGIQYHGYNYLEHGVRWGTNFDRRDPFSGMVKLSSVFAEPDSRYFFWGRVIGWEGNSPQNPPHNDLLSRSSLRDVPPSWRPLAVEMMASYVTFHDDRSVKELLPISETIPAELRGYFYKGIFSDFAARSKNGILRDKNVLNALNPDDRKWFYWGLGSESGYQFFENQTLDSQIMALMAGAEEDSKKWFYRGLGSAAFGTDQPTFFINTDFMRQANVMKINVPREYEKDFYWGIGWVIRLFFRDDSVRARDWLARVNAPFQESSAKGFEACEAWYGLN